MTNTVVTINGSVSVAVMFGTSIPAIANAIVGMTYGITRPAAREIARVFRSVGSVNVTDIYGMDYTITAA